MTETPDDVSRKHQELMLRIARQPGFCCGCICLPREDRRRAKRVFRFARTVMRAWEKERQAESQTLPQDRL